MNRKMPFIGVEDKAVEVYSKFSIDEFWKFIAPNGNEFYEVRIKSAAQGEKMTQYIKDLGKKLGLPYHWTGVFVRNADEYRKVMAYCFQNKRTAYLSVNPKRRSLHGSDGMKFPTFNGKKQSEAAITFLLLDLDPSDALKANPDLKSEEVCYGVAKKFLEARPTIKSYCMVCSGNGIQLRIPLDKPIPLPIPTYDKDGQFITTQDWQVYSKILKRALEVSWKKHNTPAVKVDTSSLELARVGRAPFSRNWKDWDNPKFAGIVELVNDEPNDGLWEHIMSFYDELLKAEESSGGFTPSVAKEFECDETNIRWSKIGQLMLSARLPAGGRNSILWFQFKCLCKDCGIPLKCSEVVEIQREIGNIQRDEFALSEVSDDAHFNPEAVNNWCLEYRIRPLYDIRYKRTTELQSLTTDELKVLLDVALRRGLTIPLPDERNIVRRIEKHLLQHPIRTAMPHQRIEDIITLLRSCVTTFGVEHTQWLVETYSKGGDPQRSLLVSIITKSAPADPVATAAKSI